MGGLGYTRLVYMGGTGIYVKTGLYGKDLFICED
jgi:hypothetical protein